MSDLIDRQAAIDACIRVQEHHAYDEIEEIKALPSAQPETRDKHTETHACDLIDRQQVLNLFPTHDWKHLYDAVKDLPSAQPEKVDIPTVDTPTVDTPTCEDVVSRQAVYNVLDKMPVRGFKKDGETIHGLISLSQVNSAIINLPSAQPELNLDEWCTDCKEYDHERHCCPRWNRVIRQTLKDMKEEQPEIIRCKDCKYQVNEWRTDKRLKDKGYMVCGCEVVGDACGYWALLGQDDDYCSMAERRTDEQPDQT